VTAADINNAYANHTPAVAKQLINQIQQATDAWNKANAAGDRAGMDAAHASANAARAQSLAAGQYVTSEGYTRNSNGTAATGGSTNVYLSTADTNKLATAQSVTSSKNSSVVASLAVATIMPEVVSLANASSAGFGGLGSGRNMSTRDKGGTTYTYVRDLFSATTINYSDKTKAVIIKYTYRGSVFTIEYDIQSATNWLGREKKDVVISATVTAPDGTEESINVLYNDQKTYIDNTALQQFVSKFPAGAGGKPSGTFGGRTGRPSDGNQGTGSTGHSTNVPLTLSQMMDNANIVYDYLIKAGWTVEAISAVISNMVTESTINPGRYQSGGNGFGLIQWDDRRKNLESWLDNNNYERGSMFGQLEYMLIEMGTSGIWFKNGNAERGQYYMKSSDFIASTEDVGYLSKVFQFSFERGGYGTANNRADNAVQLYNYFTNGTTPVLKDQYGKLYK